MKEKYLKKFARYFGSEDRPSSRTEKKKMIHLFHRYKWRHSAILRFLAIDVLRGEG